MRTALIKLYDGELIKTNVTDLDVYDIQQAFRSKRDVIITPELIVVRSEIKAIKFEEATTS